MQQPGATTGRGPSLPPKFTPEEEVVHVLRALCPCPMLTPRAIPCDHLHSAGRVRSSTCHVRLPMEGNLKAYEEATTCKCRQGESHLGST